MQRVLLLTPGFAADESDQNCIPVLQLLVKDLLERGLEVCIVALEYPFKDKPYSWNGATIYPCNGRNRFGYKPRTLWRAWKYSQDILQKWRANSPDSLDQPVLHSFWLGWASFIGERVARRKGLPHYTTLMGQDVRPANRWHFTGMTPDRCKRLIAVSNFQKDVFLRSTGLEITQVIPWGVNLSEIPTGWKDIRSIDVLGAGSLIPVKNWVKWLNTIAGLIEKVPDLKAEILGGGPEMERLKTQARALGIEHNVVFSGELPRASVLAKMRQSKVFFHTARFESFGFVLAEAAMNGCRLISTPVGIAPDLGACAETENDLCTLLLSALHEKNAVLPIAPFTMSMTASRYLSIWYSP